VAFANTFTWAITTPSAAGNVSRDGTTTTDPTTVTLTAQAVGVTGTFANPFTSRVEFWAQTGANTWRQIGVATTPTVVDNGVVRTWAFSVVWDPSTYSAPATGAVYNVVAIGISAAGDGLVTNANADITVTP
jgi:hypothetical protein